MRASFWLGMTLFCAHAFAGTEPVAPSWQGEWGQWTQSPPGTNPALTGSSISIFACSQADGTCRLRLEATSDKGRCSFVGKNTGQEMRLTSPVTATVAVRGFDGSAHDCRIDLALDATDTLRQIRASLSGDECGYFCAHDVIVPETHPFRTNASYPQQAVADCFADQRASRRSWCLNTDLQAQEKRLNELSNTYAELSHDASNHSLSRRLPTDREALLDTCNRSQQIESCLKSGFERLVVNYSHETDAARSAHDALEVQLATKGDPGRAEALIDAYAGVYKHRFPNGLVDGSTFTSENILEVVKVSPDTVYFRTHLEFYNGHTCALYGLASYMQAGTFVFNDPSGLKDGLQNRTCRMQLRLDAEGAALIDPDHGCNLYCGVRGGIDGTTFTAKERGTIRYMSLLKNSRQYQESIKLLPAPAAP